MMPVSGCKINVDNIFQLKIDLDCFVSVTWSCLHCHLFCTYACVVPTCTVPHIGTRPGSKSLLVWLPRITE